MIKAIKVKLEPTAEQAKMLRKTANHARGAWNRGLGYIVSEYEKGNRVSPMQARQVMTDLKKSGKDYLWLNEISADAWRNVFQDMTKAFQIFFDNIKNGVPFADAGYPQFKKKSKARCSFFHDPRKLKVRANTVQLEKIGVIKIKDENRLPRGVYKKERIKVSNVRITYDNKHWILTCGIEVEEESWVPNPDLSIGIDMGIKSLAVTNVEGLTFGNINKSPEIKRLEKKHKRLSRQISRKYEANKVGEKFVKTKNIVKLETLRKQLDRRMRNIRDNYLHQTTKTIIKQKPSKIVVEDLNVKGMMKNKHLAKSVAHQKFYEFRRQLEYKAQFYLGIAMTIADRWFPSSKMCSRCKKVKSDLKLKDRVYRCLCGNTIDRDINAAINLANYSI
jgi:putative transposase